MSENMRFLYDSEDCKNNYNFKNQFEIYSAIIKKINAFRNDFDQNCKNIEKELELSFNTNEITIQDLFTLLMFGENEELKSCSSKLDFNKNKALLKTCLLNGMEINTSTRFLKKIVILCNEFFLEISQIFDCLNNIESDLTDESFIRIQNLLDSFLYESTHIRENTSTLITLTDKITENEIFKVTHPFCKLDTIKKYYFTHVYDLKNSVKIFDKNYMIYGEINNVMRIFDGVFNFLCGDMIYMYNTLFTIFNYTSDNINRNFQSVKTK